MKRHRWSVCYVVLILNNMNNKLAVAQQKLKALQLPDGSWSWYNGMSGSRYITTYVLETLLRLGRNQDAKLPAETEEMLVGALNYLHAEMLKVYQHEQEALKKGQTEPGITYGQTEYLYLVYLWGKGYLLPTKRRMDISFRNYRAR